MAVTGTSSEPLTDTVVFVRVRVNFTVYFDGTGIIAKHVCGQFQQVVQVLTKSCTRTWPHKALDRPA